MAHDRLEYFYVFFSPCIRHSSFQIQKSIIIALSYPEDSRLSKVVDIQKDSFTYIVPSYVSSLIPPLLHFPQRCLSTAILFALRSEARHPTRVELRYVSPLMRRSILSSLFIAMFALRGEVRQSPIPTSDDVWGWLCKLVGAQVSSPHFS